MGPTTTPRRDRRQVVYEFLKERGEVGATNRELCELVGIHSPMVHVESLRREGHRIETFSGHDDNGQHHVLIRLVGDAWDGREAA